MRVDDTNFDFPVQISPKAALVFEPVTGQSIRFTYNRSWLRPSFAELYRKSPAGRPVPGTVIEAQVDSLTSLQVGEQVSSNLGMTASTPVWNLGNPTVKPETAQSFELGYRGTAFKRLFVEVSGYWNRRSDLLSNPLGGLAPSVYAPVRSNTGNAEYDAVADGILDSLLRTDHGRSISQLSEYQDNPALVVVPTNIAIVDEFGLELGATYFLTNELSVSANYAYLDVQVQDNAIEANRILPNTSPHRINLGVEYMSPGQFDARVDFRYVEGFDWIAGLIEGNVPAYAVMNLSAGYYVLPDLRVGLNVFNLLDREHYQIFGGTILRREVTGSITYNF